MSLTCLFQFLESVLFYLLTRKEVPEADFFSQREIFILGNKSQIYSLRLGFFKSLNGTEDVLSRVEFFTI